MVTLGLLRELLLSTATPRRARGTPAEPPPAAGHEPSRSSREPPARRCSCALSQQPGRDAPSPGWNGRTTQGRCPARTAPGWTHAHRPAGAEAPGCRGAAGASRSAARGSRSAPPQGARQSTRRSRTQPQGRGHGQRTGAGGAASPGTSEGAG